MKTIKKDQIFLEISKVIISNQPIVVGVSWWPDSMLLLTFIQEYYESKWRNQANIYVAHFNHWQRKESYKDQKLVEKYSKYNTFYWNPKKPKKWLSETKLREERHSFFDEVVTKTKSQYVLLWHNLTDRIETTLLNTVRWSWIDGILWIKKQTIKKNYTIYRPLLGISKEDITYFCDKNNIPYKIDKTNITLITQRNIIRNKIVPKIRSLHNAWEKNWYNTRETLYKTIENNTTQTNNWQSHITHPLRWATFRQSIPKKNITDTDRYNLFKTKYYITKKTIVTLNSFVTSGSWYLFIWWIYIFIVGDKVHCIDWKKDFWKKKYDFVTTIKGHWKQVINWYTYLIPKKYVWKSCRYPQEWDTYKKKRLLKVMLNNKIPVFMRNTTPVIIDWSKIISLLLPL